jgi:hypothetical protein
MKIFKLFLFFIFYIASLLGLQEDLWQAAFPVGTEVNAVTILGKLYIILAFRSMLYL